MNNFQVQLERVRYKAGAVPSIFENPVYTGNSRNFIDIEHNYAFKARKYS